MSRQITKGKSECFRGTFTVDFSIDLVQKETFNL